MSSEFCIIFFQFQNNYLADKVKEYETTNKELREEAVKKTELLEEVEEKDKVYAFLRVFTLWLFILYVLFDAIILMYNI